MTVWTAGCISKQKPNVLKHCSATVKVGDQCLNPTHPDGEWNFKTAEILIFMLVFKHIQEKPHR